MSENKKIARFISPGKVKELMIKVIRKEMSYDANGCFFRKSNNEKYKTQWSF